jgi:hypothetical protein
MFCPVSLDAYRLVSFAARHKLLFASFDVGARAALRRRAVACQVSTASRMSVGLLCGLRGAVMCGVVILLASSAAFAQLDVDAATNHQAQFFESRIRPALIESCLDCHSTQTETNGELVLDSREGWLRGGSSGPAIVPGQPEESLLIKAIGYDNPHLQMPPDGRLPDRVQSDFRAWIEAGAYDPRVEAPAKRPALTALSVSDAQQHWAYRPLADIEIPLAGEQGTEPGPSAIIDAFIDQRLAAVGLSPNPPAEPHALVRRLYYDLTGLPPTPEELQAYLSDAAPETAYARLVDRLLMSPRFGETMARRWMDVVRYADSVTLRGFVLPQAWRYRDYLIRSYNEDRSFASMIEEQVAGDLLHADDCDQRQQQLVATTFWTLGNTNLEQQDKTQLEMDYIDEQLDVLGKALLGQTLGCARCHDHKFDPIPTRDYYALAGILRSTAGMDHENVSKWIEQPLPLSPEEEQHYEALSGRRQHLVQAIKDLKQTLGAGGATSPKHIRIDTLEGIVVDNRQAKLVGEWTSSTSNPPIIGEDYLHDGNTGKGEKSATFEPDSLPPGEYTVRISHTPGSNRASRVLVQVFSAAGEKEVLIDQRMPAPEDGAWVALGTFPFEKDGQAFVMVSNANTDGHVIIDAVQFLPKFAAAPPVHAEEIDDARLQAMRETLAAHEAELKQLDQQLAERPQFMTIVERNEPRDIPIHIRGDVHNLGAIVPRGVLTALPPPANDFPAHGVGRLEMARWLSDSENPLTARVYSNRVWTWLMGQGIVSSVDNFGTTGLPPTHPELLDWLASEFMQSNWSTKSLVRAIVLTRAYKRSSSSDLTGCGQCAAHEADPQNRWLWRGHKRRLDAEALRDAMLSVSGELDLTMGGSLIPAGVSNDYNFSSEVPRRSIYQPVFRNSLPQLFESFDFANPSAPVGQRPRSTVATQALELMNHPWVAQRASRAAERFTLAMPTADAETLMQTLTSHCFGRSATAAELQLSQALLGEHPLEKVDRDQVAMLVHAFFASLDFRFLE